MKPKRYYFLKELLGGQVRHFAIYLLEVDKGKLTSVGMRLTFGV